MSFPVDNTNLYVGNGLLYNPQHPLNRNLVYWQLFYPQLTAPYTGPQANGYGLDITRRNKQIYTGEATDWRDATFGQARYGGIGAIHFTGGSDRLIVLNEGQFSDLKKLTIAVVFREQVLSGGNETRVLLSRNPRPLSDSTDLSFYIEFRATSSGLITLRFVVSVDGTWGNIFRLDYNWSSTFVARKPNWGVFTWDGKNMYMYLAETDEGQVTLRNSTPADGGGQPIFDNGYDFYIGSYTDNRYSHIGPVDDIRIVNDYWDEDMVKLWVRESRTYNRNLLAPYLVSNYPVLGGSNVFSESIFFSFSKNVFETDNVLANEGVVMSQNISDSDGDVIDANQQINLAESLSHLINENLLANDNVILSTDDSVNASSIISTQEAVTFLSALSLVASASQSGEVDENIILQIASNISSNAVLLANGLLDLTSTIQLLTNEKIDVADLITLAGIIGLAISENNDTAESLNLSFAQNVIINNSVVGFDIKLPDGRTLRISFDLRTFKVSV